MKNKGFTLIELMIVVAIIAIIAAIAIPNLLRSRLQSNESAAIANLKTLVGAETAFAAANGGYTADWDLLNTPDEGPPFLDIELGGGIVQGYTYALEEDGEEVTEDSDFFTNFTCTASPATDSGAGAGATGIRVFWVDAGGVIRLDDADGNPI
ncbi:MAG: prepilin-type N-terminal cleavage/methylation domain-containing protein [Candidatus Hydrogenedentes bacterium]|nr:prepilin-type N-terminal cleavage/methylation domain-containing protein [Candidatus Hydrogenedentota bacterium]